MYFKCLKCLPNIILWSLLHNLLYYLIGTGKLVIFTSVAPFNNIYACRDVKIMQNIDKIYS